MVRIAVPDRSLNVILKNSSRLASTLLFGTYKLKKHYFDELDETLLSLVFRISLHNTRVLVYLGILNDNFGDEKTNIKLVEN